MLFILIFATSLLLTYGIIKAPDHWVSNEHESVGVQKFHYQTTPHIGGIAVFISFSVGLWLLDIFSDTLLILWLASLPVFVVGMIEDFSAKVPPKVRLISALMSIVIAFVWLNIGITELGFSWVDQLLSEYWIASLLFTLLVVAGAINSFNIIDGFNGLLSGYSLLASLAIAYIAYLLGDSLMLKTSLILFVSVLGFFIFNFPFGKIFMGDGGAYFIGFILSIIGLMLVSRHKELSNWFVLLIFIYPMYELLYSIYRRKFIHKTSASQPDTNHLHSLVYRKLISCDRFEHNKTICNSMTSPVIWPLSLLGIVPAIVWFDNQTMLIVSVFVFMFIYTFIYKYISSDKIKFNR